MRDPRFPDRPAQSAVPQTGERLQKVLADAGLASRRDVEFAVRAGRVRVNGRRVVALPCLVDPARDLIELDGEVVELAGRPGPRSRERLYLMLNKPKGVISTARDPGGRANVVDLVRAGVPAGHRVYPVGRLDADSTGLVLLTNDGELAHRLAHPSSRIPKEYRVAVQGALTDGALAQLSKGMFLADVSSREGGAKRARMQSVRVLKRTKNRRDGDLSLVSVTLTEGQNREIRRLFARVGIKVRGLERTALGALHLGRLPRGQFRALNGEEVLSLRRSVRLG
ncbi:MAG TPA: pseudouridine synthase [Steroidobacteraceae bacterium]|jgi:pseudouridine synthase|nr:pseudouridine synthase [Steroidobacteraceae bacterium]